ncbi:FAD-dependent oxidoreductase [Streptosporangium saharense]|uniref:FAD-dependent oxidoreductase n=1 Tax=Streptosporangium saharense TaxID=1706840 RepID=UPI00332C1B96
MPAIAGPALAYWLRHHGFTPTVVERAPRVRAGGSAVGFRGEALDVLDRMALPERAHTLNTHPGETASADRDGGPYTLEILRGDLIDLLYEATRREVEYVLDDSIAALEQNADGVRVTFERGRPRRFDLVAGADGLRSRTRSQVFGPRERFVRHPGLYTAAFGLPSQRDTGLFHSMPGKAADLLRARDDVAQHKRIVAEWFAGEGGLIPHLLEEMGRAEDSFFDANAQVEMDRWSSGRVVLLGDAGYCAAPASGHGASILAGELGVADGDHATAFAAYERETRGFVAEHQQLGREGIDRFFLGAPIRETPDTAAAEATLARVVRVEELRLQPRRDITAAMDARATGPDDRGRRERSSEFRKINELSGVS